MRPPDLAVPSRLRMILATIVVVLVAWVVWKTIDYRQQPPPPPAQPISAPSS
ncbi:MAG: hypothetical protein H0X40_08870 [Chthoniobacterales bacterium]|nr:hypothetical protein [Chthoniobacterales bacterium]